MVDIQIEYIEENGTLWAKGIWGGTWDRLEALAEQGRLVWSIPRSVVSRVDELNLRSAELAEWRLLADLEALKTASANAIAELEEAKQQLIGELERTQQQLDRLRSKVIADTLTDHPTEPYDFENHSLPFQSPESPFPTDSGPS